MTRNYRRRPGNEPTYNCDDAQALETEQEYLTRSAGGKPVAKLPSPLRLAIEAAKLRAKWSEQETAKRARGFVSHGGAEDGPEPLTVPQVDRGDRHRAGWAGDRPKEPGE